MSRRGCFSVPLDDEINRLFAMRDNRDHAAI
jgi:hypothetical protein